MLFKSIKITSSRKRQGAQSPKLCHRLGNRAKKAEYLKNKTISYWLLKEKIFAQIFAQIKAQSCNSSARNSFSKKGRDARLSTAATLTGMDNDDSSSHWLRSKLKAFWIIKISRSVGFSPNGFEPRSNSVTAVLQITKPPSSAFFFFSECWN